MRGRRGVGGTYEGKERGGRDMRGRRGVGGTYEGRSPTFHHTLHCAPPATATSSNQEPSGKLVTVHSLLPHLVQHGIAYQQD